MLEPNQILDIELGQITPNIAVGMLLEERTDSVHEVQSLTSQVERLEHLETDEIINGTIDDKDDRIAELVAEVKRLSKPSY